jgi:hypothetical protein
MIKPFKTDSLVSQHNQFEIIFSEWSNRFSNLHLHRPVTRQLVKMHSMKPLSIWPLTNAALLEFWQKQSQMLQDWTVFCQKWPNRVTGLTLFYLQKTHIHNYFILKNLYYGQWDTHYEWRLIPGREKFFPHHVQGTSWSTHLSTLSVLWILSLERGREGWTVSMKHTAVPELSVPTFIQCIWTPVPNSVPTEILFHSLYTKTVQLNLSTCDSQTHCN